MYNYVVRNIVLL